MWEHAVDTALQHKTHDNIYALRTGQLGSKVRKERIAFPCHKLACVFLLWLIREVVGAGGNDVADAAPRVLDISEISRNHVQVEVIHRLTRGGSHINANVESVGNSVLLPDRFPSDI